MATTTVFAGVRTGQRRAALESANAVRCAGAAVKREVTAGLLDFADALHDPRSQRLKIKDLLLAVPFWGHRKADYLLFSLKISGTARVGALSDVRKGELSHYQAMPTTRRTAKLLERNRLERLFGGEAGEAA